MTGVATPIPVTVRLPETGVSLEALAWRQMWRQQLASDTSITRGAPFVDILERVESTAAKAACSNWDGEGAVAVAASTREFARVFAVSLPAPLQGRANVVAEKDGDISFDWGTGLRQVFSVSVRQDGSLSYAGLFGPKRIYGADILAAGLTSDLVQYISRAAGS